MRTMIAVERAGKIVDCIINVKEWTGVYRFTGWCLSNKIGNILGEQITAGQLTK